jgi:hypothetical protein
VVCGQPRAKRCRGGKERCFHARNHTQRTDRSPQGSYRRDRSDCRVVVQYSWTVPNIVSAASLDRSTSGRPRAAAAVVECGKGERSCGKHVTG